MQYSGADRKDNVMIDNLATSVCVAAARIASLTRADQGDRSAPDLPRDVRRALEFTNP
jgi:hypothetical protein